MAYYGSCRLLVMGSWFLAFQRQTEQHVTQFVEKQDNLANYTQIFLKSLMAISVLFDFHPEIFVAKKPIND